LFCYAFLLFFEILGDLPPALEDLVALEVLALQREGGTDSSVQGNVGVNQGESEDKGPGLTGPLLSFSKQKTLKQLFLGVNSLSGKHRMLYISVGCFYNDES